ncbi:hypothetical protein RBE51_19875 [Pseudomonas taiwanensis]|uniref:hypothetical protein n=1 Tax=Pseudomonas taiwanensis TaxID=470150 RepID=UPI0028E081DE|nr:hypothetical protein [Pseudomonas taiwanensis]MDT8925052.1 hypothetical protein [Pseudomonas taiwanensis]
MHTLDTPLAAGQNLACPHCNADQGEQVEDFVIPGRVGAASACADSCCSCGAIFRVTCVEPGQFRVSVADTDLVA